MDSLQMYRKLLKVFQETDHEENKAVNAVIIFEKLRFDRNSRHSPEEFLAKVNDCLKRMEVENTSGNTVSPVNKLLLPGIL